MQSAISIVSAEPAGNALRVVLTPPAGAIWWRILRRTDASFAGASDPAAVVVADRLTSDFVVDYTGLANGTPYFYAFYSTVDGTTFVAGGAPVQGTPATTYQDASVDPQVLVRNRLILGLAAEVARGTLIPETGVVPVFTAAFALPDKMTFPCVTVHLDSTGPEEHFIGDDMANEAVMDGDIIDATGWRATFSLNVVGTSLNMDERMALRMALRRIVQANLPIFDAAGLVNVNFTQQDSEQFSENSAPIYMTMGLFTCEAVAALTTQTPPGATSLGINVNIQGSISNG